jgi:mRNA interferase MazF
VLLVDFPQHQPPGHEQEGYRPAVMVGRPERVGTPRFPLLVVVPLTTQSGPWASQSPDLYPRLAAGAGGLPQDSVVLLDNVRCVDRHRVRGSFGTLTEEAYAPVREGLRRLFDF